MFWKPLTLYLLLIATVGAIVGALLRATFGSLVLPGGWLGGLVVMVGFLWLVSIGYRFFLRWYNR